MKTNKKRKWLKLLLIFASIYLLVAILIWMDHNVLYIIQRENTEKKNAQIYGERLKTTLFREIYDKAEQCNKFTSEEALVKCRKQVSEEIRLFFFDDELHAHYGFGSIMFVKKTGDEYKRLTSDGELRDISLTINRELLTSDTPYVINYTNRDCNYIHFIPNTKNACEMPVAIPINEHEMGYIIYFLPKTEEDDFVFLLTFLPATLVFQLQYWVINTFNLQ